MGEKRSTSGVIRTPPNLLAGYARAHDKTVETDFFNAMQRIEARLELAPQPAVSERTQLLSLVGQLFQPELSDELRLQIASQMCSLLDPCLPLP